MATTLRKFGLSGGRTVWRRALQAAGAAPLAAMWLALSMSPGDCKDRLAKYTYKDTQDLVSLVEDAATLIETKGDEAFKEFARKDSKWLNAD